MMSITIAAGFCYPAMAATPERPTEIDKAIEFKAKDMQGVGAALISSTVRVSTLSITLLALLPAVSIFFVMRKFASTHLYWSGGIAMLAAFSVGALWLRLYEQTDSIMHVIEWHYLPMVLIGLTGMVLGKLILKWQQVEVT